MKRASSWLLLLPLLILVGCSVRLGEPADGPGRHIDPDSVPSVVPKSEAKSQYGNPESYVVHGRRYHVLDSARGYAAEGIASWYGSKFHGRRTSSGEAYNMYAMTAAHKSLPLPTYVRVTNLDNGRSAILRVNDRGPFVDDRLIDLSYAAAVRLDVVSTGTARVRVEAVPGGTPITATATSTAAAADGDADLFVQVGAFRHYANAQEMRARIQGVDIRGVGIARATASSGQDVYRVRIGPLNDSAEGERILDRLEGAGIGPAHMVAE